MRPDPEFDPHTLTRSLLRRRRQGALATHRKQKQVLIKSAMKLYATELAGAAASGGEWRCTGCDPDGIDLVNGTEVVRITFPERVRDPMTLRATLRRLADQARGHNH